MATGDELIQLLSTHGHQFKGTDKSFAVEGSLISMLAGQASTMRVKALLMKAFPSAEKNRDCEATMAELKLHTAAEGFKYLPAKLQNIVRYAITMVKAVDNQNTDALKLGSMGAISTECWRRCAFFLRANGSIDGKAASKEHSGAAAIKVLLTKISKVSGAKLAEVSAELEQLQKFAFAAADEDIPLVREQLKKRVAPAHPKGAKKSKHAAEAAKTKAAKEMEAAELEAMASFC